LPTSRISSGSWLPSDPIQNLVLYVDGSSVPNPGPSAFGLLALAQTALSNELFGCLKNIGFAGNNQAEFEGIVAACDLVRAVKPRKALIISDSTVGLRLATNKVRAGGVIDRGLQWRLATWLRQSPRVRLVWAPRESNFAHHLARSAVDLEAGAEVITPLGAKPLLRRVA
jgi:ribonuclease HI